MHFPTFAELPDDYDLDLRYYDDPGSDSDGITEPIKHWCLLAEIVQRGMVKSGRLARLSVDARDVPGALADLASLLGTLGANIEEVRHQRAFTSLSVERVEIEFVLQTKGNVHVAEILTALREKGYAAQRAD